MKTRSKWCCRKCGRCCKNVPGKYLPKDFSDVGQDLDKMLAEKTIEFGIWDHPEIFRSKLKFILFPTPAKSESGSCIFLDKDNLCTIYAKRPSECRWLINCRSSCETKKATTLDDFVKAIDAEQAYQLNFIYSWIKYQGLIKRLLRKHQIIKKDEACQI